MPRDNHPRFRQARALARKKGKRQPYDRILIVCEGEKTEPNYLEAIRQQNRLASSHIKIINGDGTQPRQIVDFAEKTFLESKAYERVYAIFDRDSHTTYHDALNRALQLDSKYKNDESKTVRFIAIPSVPCFELWLLLHYQDVLAFFERDVILRKLKVHIPDYAKGAQNIYSLTEGRIEGAIQRAQHLRAQFTAITGTDPYTQIDHVVTLLRSMRAAI